MKPATSLKISQWNDFIQSATTPMWVADEVSFAIVNSAAVQLFGASTKEALMARSDLVASWAIEGSPPYETTLLKLDGSEVRVRLASWPAGEAGLRIFQAIRLDVSQIDTNWIGELRRSLLSSDVDCIMILSSDGNLLFMNPVSRKLMAMEDLQSIQRLEWLSFWSDEHRHAAARALDEARVGRVGRFVGVMDGQTAFWDVVLTPMQDSQGSIQRILCISRDVSEMRRAQLLESAERKALEASASNRPAQEVFDTICALAEYSSGGAGRCSLAAAGETAAEHMRVVSAPSIPALVGARIPRKALEDGGTAILPFLEFIPAAGATTFPLWGPEQQFLGMLILWTDSSEPALDLRLKLETSANLAAIVLTRDSHLRRLRKKQERLEAISRAAPVGLYQVDPSGNWVYANERFTQMTGFSAERCNGDGWLETVHPDDRSLVEQIWRSAAAASSEFRAEYRLAKSDNRGEQWVMGCETSSGDDGGRLGTITDITDLKQALAAVADIAERFQTLANNINQLSWMADSSGWVFWYSDRWFEYTGTTLEEMEGWGWRKVHHPDHVDRVVEKISRCWQTGEVWEDSFPLRAKNGTYRWFLSRAQPIRDASGKITRWFGTNTDVTESRQLEGALHRQNLALQRSNEDLSRFAFIASHDLQEPLRLISSYAQLVLRSSRDRLDEKSAAYMDAIFEATGRMNKLIRDLLAYAQASSEKDQPAARIDLNQLITDASDNLRASIAETGAKITQDPMPEVWAVGNQIMQVLQNLFSNSIKYRRPNAAPEIHVSAKKEGQYWRIIVRDNGQGFEPEHASRVFDFLKRLHGRDVPGTGIGLAICKSIVERNGGTIGADAIPGVGATFWFTLPNPSE